MKIDEIRLDNQNLEFHSFEIIEEKIRKSFNVEFQLTNGGPLKSNFKIGYLNSPHLNGFLEREDQYFYVVKIEKHSTSKKNNDIVNTSPSNNEEKKALLLSFMKFFNQTANTAADCIIEDDIDSFLNLKS